MGVKTLYECDRCHCVSENTNDNDVQRVSVVYGSTFTRGDKGNRHAFWCRTCRIFFGIESQTGKHESVMAPQPTLEDLIKEIAREVLDERDC